RPGPGLLARAPVPRPAPHRQCDRAGRRRQRPAPRRDLAGPQRRAVPGRTARMGPARAGGAARAARIGPGDHLARRAPGRVPGPLPAGRGHEPRSLRLGRRCLRALPLHRRGDRALPCPDLRPAARPHRPVRRGAAPAAGRAAARCADRRGQRRDPCAGGGGARDPAAARRRPQRTSLAGRHHGRLPAAVRRPGAAGARRRGPASVRPGHAPHPARGPHHRRPGRQRRHRHRAPDRGAGLPPGPPPRRPPGGVTNGQRRRRAHAVSSGSLPPSGATMHRLLLASAITVALAACSDTGAVDQTAAAPASIDAVELIPRDALFGNPERANVQMSPDGRYLSWVAPLDGTLNVWVAPAGDLSAARAVTRDDARGIRSYFWSYLDDTLLYLRDTGGDEDFHLYAVNLASGESRDLTPYEQTTAQVVGVSDRHPGAVLVGMNDRAPKWHDLYRVDLASGERSLVERNTDRIAEYVADADYRLRFASRSREDGGIDLLRREGEAWTEYDSIPFEDGLTTGYAGLSKDGATLYMRDSRNRNTNALF